MAELENSPRPDPRPDGPNQLQRPEARPEQSLSELSFPRPRPDSPEAEILLAQADPGAVRPVPRPERKSPAELDAQLYIEENGLQKEFKESASHLPIQSGMERSMVDFVTGLIEYDNELFNLAEQHPPGLLAAGLNDEARDFISGVIRNQLTEGAQRSLSSQADLDPIIDQALRGMQATHVQLQVDPQAVFQLADEYLEHRKNPSLTSDEDLLVMHAMERTFDALYDGRPVSGHNFQAYQAEVIEQMARFLDPGELT